ncbi:hypothetical protein L0F63_000457 [Massospora cicadina]|nr:hypothetical protein L0F63_000457 [Massospora cicadina]
MLDSSTRTNVFAFKGLNQLRWACYSHTAPIATLGTQAGVLFKDSNSLALSEDLILEAHRTLLDNDIPALLSVERAASDPEALTLGLFVFWITEPAALVAKLRALREVRSGLITSDMLQNVSASDLDALFSDDDSKEPVALSVPLHPTSFLMSAPHRRALSEMEVFLLAIRNLLTRNLARQGFTPLGRLYLPAPTPNSFRQGGPTEDGVALTFDMWLVASALYARARFKPHHYVSAALAPQPLESGTPVVTSPHASPGRFMGFVQEADEQEAKLVDVWAKRVGVPAKVLFPEFGSPRAPEADRQPPPFCFIQTPGSKFSLIYPTKFVFVRRPAQAQPTPPEPELSVLTVLSSMLQAAATCQLEPEPLKPQEPPPLASVPTSEVAEPNYTPVIESARTSQLDRWLDSLLPNLRPKVEDGHGGEFTSSACPFPLTGLTPGCFNGTDPTPPTDSEVGPDSEFVGADGGLGYNDTFATDFGLEDFDCFQINDADFSYFDRKDPKPPGCINTPISLPEPTVVIVEPAHGPLPAPQACEPVGATPPPKANKGSLKRAHEVVALVASHDPWVPKAFQPIPGLNVGSGYLFRTKFSVLSSHLAERVRQATRPSPTAYTAHYRPAKRRRIVAPPRAPVCVPCQEAPPQVPVLAALTSDSSTEDSSSSADETASAEETGPITPAFISPDVACAWVNEPRTGAPPPQSGAPGGPKWDDPAVLRLFMDQLRTYPLAAPLASAAHRLKGSASKLWGHVVDLSRSLLALFHSEGVGGPLTLQECCEPNPRNHPRRELPDPTPPITWAPPAKIQAYVAPTRLAELDIASVAFWKEVGLRPVAGQRDASYLCFFARPKPDIAELVDAVRDSYESCQLGCLTPLPFPHAEKGLCAISVGSRGYVSAIENLGSASALLGSELARLAPEAPPENLLVLYVAPESPSPSHAVWDICVAFRKLQDQLQPAVAARVHFQIIPSLAVAQFNAQRLPLNYLPTLGFNLYSKLGPTYGPAFALSQPPPTQVRYRLPRSPDCPQFDYAETLHVTYAWGPAEGSLVAVWMDHCARVMDHCLLPVPARAFSNEGFLVDQLWRATRRFLARLKFHPRLVVTKLGWVEAGELAAWDRCLSHIPGSCVLAAGIDCHLELFEPVGPAAGRTAVAVLSDLRVPHARNVVSRAVGLLRAELPSSQLVQVVLLADSFNLVSPPVPPALAFRRVLVQLQDLAAYDGALRVPTPVPLDPTAPPSAYPPPAFPLPWRWVRDTCAHLEALKARPGLPPLYASRSKLAPASTLAPLALGAQATRTFGFEPPPLPYARCSDRLYSQSR